ncbi:MAG: hypothetical protein OXF11_22230 [Deltaproteobacteria bacterium]|nr:hypothetical protein [Deltaproteobacteria bacterium]
MDDKFKLNREDRTAVPGKFDDDMDAASDAVHARRGEPADYVYVREPAALARLMRRLRAAKSVALDTEADSLHNYAEKVCLIQLTVGEAHFVVDPLSELDLAAFVEVLADKRLILHGADYDLRLLRAWMGFRPRGEVFDTMVAAQLLGIEQIGLASLVEQLLDVALVKDLQKSDWSRRPLSETQLRYAVNDTRYLEALAERLHGELLQWERVAWHRESCRAMVEATGQDRARDPEDIWRIKGAGRLSRRQLAYLREIWRWRDTLARRVNRPIFKVLQNQKILELVEWADTHPGVAPDQGPRLPRDIVGSRRRALGHALDRAAAMAESEWPELRRAARPDVLPFNDKELDALRADCARIATELGIAPWTLAPKAALENIARTRPRSEEETMACSGLLRWQTELVQGAVHGALHTAERKTAAKSRRRPRR